MLTVGPGHGIILPQQQHVASAVKWLEQCLQGAQADGAQVWVLQVGTLLTHCRSTSDPLVAPFAIMVGKTQRGGTM